MSTYENEHTSGENLGLTANGVPFVIKNIRAAPQTNANYVRFIRHLLHNVMHNHPAYWIESLPEQQPAVFDLEKHPLPPRLRSDYAGNIHIPYSLLEHNYLDNIFPHPNDTELGRPVFHLVGQKLGSHLPIDKAELAAFHDYYQEVPQALQELQKENPYIQDPEQHQVDMGNKDASTAFIHGLLGNMLSHAYEQYAKHISALNHHESAEPFYGSVSGFYNHTKNNMNTKSQDPMTKELYQRFKEGLRRTL